MVCASWGRLAGGRWLLTGGGGYDLVQVVTRTWTHLLADVAGQPVDPGNADPGRWREYVARRTGLTAPGQMTDGTSAVFEPFESGCNPLRSGRPGHHGHRSAVFPCTG